MKFARKFAALAPKTALRSFTCLSLVGAGILLAPLAGLADDTYYVMQVQSRLMDLAERMGFVSVSEPYVSLLNRESYDSVTYTLEAGTPYMIMATCDEDCDDLDLELYDADGNLLTFDSAVDPTPMVSFTPDYSGPYTVDVIMYSCSTSACYQAVDVFVAR